MTQPVKAREATLAQHENVRNRAGLVIGGGLVTLIALIVVLKRWAPGSPGDIRGMESGTAGYAAIGLFAFLEVGTFLGLVAPFEVAIVIGGALAAAGELSLPVLMLVVWVSASLGDTCNFFVGRRLGRAFLIRHGGRLRVRSAQLERLERYFERRGPATVFLGRFGPFVRTLTPFIAGSAGMPYSRFAPWSILGCAAFAVVLSGIGFLFSRTLERAQGALGAVGLGAVLAVALVVVVRMIRVRRRNAATHPAARPR